MGDIVDFDRRKKTVSNLKIDRNVVDVAVNKKMKIKRVAMLGTVIVVTAAIALAAFGLGKDKSGSSTGVPGTSVTVDTDSEDYSISTNTEALSSLNVVLVDDGIDDEKIEKLASDLNNSGLEVEVRDINSLNSDGTETFIALKEYGGDTLKVIGNYNNGNNHADLLAISMVVEAGGDIQRGVNQVGADVTKKVPSNLEKNVVRNMPMVTLAVPYEKDMNTDTILNGLARYNDYFKENSISDADYLVRGETSVHDFVQTYGDKVLQLNDLDRNGSFHQDDVLFTKKLPASLDKKTEVSVEISKTNDYSNSY